MQKLILTTLFLVLTISMTWTSEPLTWQKVFQMIKERFPDVPEITVSEFVQLKRSSTPFHLIDVRDKKEFQISHIEAAENLTSAADITARIRHKNARVIVYCSVGWRSADVVADLQAAGYHNSLNLKGSIFEWANSGYSVYQNGKLTDRVHPYNRKWGILLKPKYHSEY